ncbi:MAG TPA: hypothetical protein PLT04_05235 [Candidatus Saccharibacteria bacterium]|nr:hypothetical protein [Candidatus Saccharibacteria bacterium]
MNETMLMLLGVSAGALNFAGMVPYVRDMFRGTTKPNRATWWLWLLINSISLASQWALGATWSLGIIIAKVIGVAITAVLSVYFGYGFFTKRDVTRIVIALIGAAIWSITGYPLFALLIVIGVDALGMGLTITKTWRAPFTETKSTWVLATIAAMLAVASVGSFDIAKLSWPVYCVVANGLLLCVIVSRQKRSIAQNQMV